MAPQTHWTPAQRLWVLTQREQTPQPDWNAIAAAYPRAFPTSAMRTGTALRIEMHKLSKAWLATRGAKGCMRAWCLLKPADEFPGWVTWGMVVGLTAYHSGTGREGRWAGRVGGGGGAGAGAAPVLAASVLPDPALAAPVLGAPVLAASVLLAPPASAVPAPSAPLSAAASPDRPAATPANRPSRSSFGASSRGETTSPSSSAGASSIFSFSPSSSSGPSSSRSAARVTRSRSPHAEESVEISPKRRKLWKSGTQAASETPAMLPTPESLRAHSEAAQENASVKNTLVPLGFQYRTEVRDLDAGVTLMSLAMGKPFGKKEQMACVREAGKIYGVETD